jgi:predicted pyridoxine 5'-phosphate oxidase superfamily flavin-nucleotide-binding protein
MRETADEVAALQALLDRSVAGGNEHLRAIMTPERLLTAEQMVGALDGMRVLVVATVTTDGRPLTSCVDAHLLHGRWVFTTDATATKARHLAERPAVSATYADGERIGVFTHGTAERPTAEHPDFAEIEEHLVAHYGSSPSTWAPDIAYLRIQPRWMLAYAADPASLESAELLTP